LVTVDPAVLSARAGMLSFSDSPMAYSVQTLSLRVAMLNP
jgi:hypothetical protein